MESDVWFVLERGEVLGPYSLAQITKMRAQKALTSFSKISHDRAVWKSLDDHLREVQFKAAAPSPLQPPPHPGIATNADPYRGESTPQRLARLHQQDLLYPFPILALTLLHFLTGGIFTFFWITSRHGVLPKMKSDDPSAEKAVGLSIVPFFNLYWLFIVYPRLAKRINAMSRQYRLPDAVSLPLTYAVCVFLAIPATMATAGSVILAMLYFSPTPKTEAMLLFFVVPNILTVLNFLIVVPIFSSQVQSGLNRIGLSQIAQLLHAQEAHRGD